MLYYDTIGKFLNSFQCVVVYSSIQNSVRLAKPPLLVAVPKRKPENSAKKHNSTYVVKIHNVKYLFENEFFPISVRHSENYFETRILYIIKLYVYFQYFLLTSTQFFITN